MYVHDILRLIILARDIYVFNTTYNIHIEYVKQTLYTRNYLRLKVAMAFHSSQKRITVGIKKKKTRRHNTRRPCGNI